MPFADAGALHDPLIVGLHQLFEVLVGEHAGRGIAAERGDFRLWQIVRPLRIQGNASWSGSRNAGSENGRELRYSNGRMTESDGHTAAGFQSSLFFETPEEIYARVFRELKPRTPVPEMQVEFCRFANADSFIRLENGSLHVRISDLLAAAPAPVMEALAYILLGKLYRKPVARVYTTATGCI